MVGAATYPAWQGRARRGQELANRGAPYRGGPPRWPSSSFARAGTGRSSTGRCSPWSPAVAAAPALAAGHQGHGRGRHSMPHPRRDSTVAGAHGGGRHGRRTASSAMVGAEATEHHFGCGLDWQREESKRIPSREFKQAMVGSFARNHPRTFAVKNFSLDEGNEHHPSIKLAEGGGSWGKGEKVQGVLGSGVLFIGRQRRFAERVHTRTRGARHGWLVSGAGGVRLRA